MPRVGFIGVAGTAEDRARAIEIRNSSSSYADKVLREIAQLEQFVVVNKFENPMPRAEVLALYGAQWLNSGRAASTLKVIMDDFKAFWVDPFNLDAARRRVEDARVKSVDRLASGQGRIFVRIIPEQALPGVLSHRPICKKECEKQSFWCLVCVTGYHFARGNMIVRRHS
jgi:hypothetical protein